MLKNLTKNRWKFAIIPALIIVVGAIFGFIHKSNEGFFNFDVEFIGGTRMEIDLKQEFSNDEVAQLVQESTPENVNAVVQKGNNDTTVIIKVPSLGNAPAAAENTAAEGTEDAASETSQIRTVDDEMRTNIINALKEKYQITDDNIISVNSASASFGKEVQTKAILFTLIAIACILIYIAIRFEWRSAVMAVIALAINVLIMASVYTITYIPLNTTFIAAMLTVIGYSINNTIVIFDRIRENMKMRKKNETISEMTDRSILETMGRTINSTITTLITIVLIYILGASTIKDFALPLIVGIIAGAYTSIFLASTFWAVWKEADIQAKALAAQDRRNAKKNK